jgi:hypothetical protein
MATYLTGQQPAPLKDRRGWLVVFGIFEILIAALCIMMVALAALVYTFPQLGQSSASQQNPGLQLSGLVVTVLFYGGAAVAFLAIGIGSIRCRNWARIGMLVVSGFWLGIGVLTMIVLFLVMPTVMRQQAGANPAVQSGVLLFMMVFMGIFMVIMPAVFLIFHSRKSVRATCLARKPSPVREVKATVATVESTEVVAPPKAKVPVPLIILAGLQAMGVLAPLGLLMVRTTFLFGIYLHGWSAFFYLAAHAALSGFAAWFIYKQRLIGWEIGLFILLFGMGSFVTTFAGHDLLQVYLNLGFGEDQLLVFKQIPQMASIVWMSSLAGMTAYFAFFVYTRKFFTTETGLESESPAWHP